MIVVIYYSSVIYMNRYWYDHFLEVDDEAGAALCLILLVFVL